MSRVGSNPIAQPLGGDKTQPLTKRASTLGRPDQIRMSARERRVAETYGPALCKALLSKPVKPHVVMAQLLKSRRHDNEDLGEPFEKILQELDGRKLKEIHHAIMRNPEIFDGINKLLDILACDATENDLLFARELSNIQMDLVTLRIAVERALTERKIPVKDIDPTIDDEKSWRVLQDLKSAWRDFTDNPSVAPKKALINRLSHAASPPRPKLSAPESKPPRRREGTPEVDRGAVMVQLAHEGTIHEGFKDLLKKALGNEDESSREITSTKVISDLTSLCTEQRRQYLDRLLDIFEDDSALKDGEHFLVMDQIAQQANDPEAQAHRLDLGKVFTVETAANCVHDIAGIHLKDRTEDELSSATTRWLRAETTPEKAADFLRFADQNYFIGRSREAHKGIRNFVESIDEPPMSETPERASSDDRQNPSWTFMLRGRVRDDFTKFGKITPGPLKTLFADAARAHTRPYFPDDVLEKGIEQLNGVPMAVGDRLLTRLLDALGMEAAGDASEPHVANVLAEIDEAASQSPPLASWQDLSRAETPLQALFVIHDLARQEPDKRLPEAMWIWGAMQLREAGISPVDARRILELAKELPLAGRSVGIRDIVRAYADGADGATAKRGAVLEHFNRQGFGDIAELKRLLAETFAQSSHSYPSEIIDTLLGLPAKECSQQLGALLNALAQEPKGPTAGRIVSKVLDKIKGEALGNQYFRGWRDLKDARTSQLASFIIHDIARKPGNIRGQKYASAMTLLRKMGITKEIAGDFMRHAAPLRLEGESARVRTLIAAFASETQPAPGIILL